MIELTPGMRLRSAASVAEVIVIKSPEGPVDMRCGGHPMVARGDESAEHLTIEPPMDGELSAGKRYASADGQLELMVTKAGAGLLTIGETLLASRDAKQLPSSD